MEKAKDNSNATKIRTPETLRMGIKGIRIKEERSGVLLRSWDEVKKAITLIGMGEIDVDNKATEDFLGRSREVYGPQTDVVASQVRHIRGTTHRERLINKILADAEKGIKRDREWQDHFEYVAFDTPFFKKSLKITFIPGTKNLYLFEYCNAAGPFLDAELAEIFDTKRVLRRVQVIAETEPVGDQFCFDYDEILMRLGKVISGLKQPFLRKRFIGSDVVAHMCRTWHGLSGPQPFLLGKSEGIAVTLNQRFVGDRFGGKERKAAWDLWNASGGVLQGPVTRGYNSSEIIPPRIEINLARADKNTLLVTDPRMEKNMLDLTSRIAEALKPA